MMFPRSDYAQGEDAITDIRPSPRFVDDQDRSETGAITVSSCDFYGPRTIGCKRHRMGGFFSITLTGEEHKDPETGYPKFYDNFFGADEAESLLNQFDDIPEIDARRGLLLSFGRRLKGDRMSLVLLGKHAANLLKDIRFNREEIQGYIEQQRTTTDPDLKPTEPKYQEPLSEKEIARLDAILDDYYKPDPRDYELEDIDPGTLLAALYNNAKTGGAGIVHFRQGEMTPAEGRHILAEIERLGEEPRIDYLNGRSIKTSFRMDTENGPMVIATRYWDYNGLPFIAIATHARNGGYQRLDGQGLLDLETEIGLQEWGFAAHQDERQAHIVKAVKDMGEMLLAADENGYIDRRKRQLENCGVFETGAPYQLSLRSSMAGEVGNRIKPFVATGTTRNAARKTVLPFPKLP